MRRRWGPDGHFCGRVERKCTCDGMVVRVELFKLRGGTVECSFQLLQLWSSCSYSEEALQGKQGGYKIIGLVELRRWSKNTQKEKALPELELKKIYSRSFVPFINSTWMESLVIWFFLKSSGANTLMGNRCWHTHTHTLVPVFCEHFTYIDVKHPIAS